MDTPQGQTEPVSAASQTQGTIDVGSATLTPEVIQKYGVEPSSSPSAAPEAQGGANGQVQQQGQPEPDAKHFQSLADQRQAENLRLQRQVDQLMEMQQKVILQQQESSQPKNPFDAATQPNDYWNWQFENAATKAARLAAEESRKASREEMVQMFQTSYEQQWQAQHPQVNIEVVKAFQNQRGIRDINDAYTLMTLPQQTAQIAQTQAQAALNQFRQPQNQGASPLRGSGQAPVQPQLSYEKLAIDFQNTNGSAYDTWPKHLQEAFDKETNLRSAALAQAGRKR